MKFEIPLQQFHICTEDCATTFIEEKIGRGWICIKRIPDPLYIDGKCPNYMKRENTYVQVCDKENLDNLIDQNECVITDTKIKIPFSYPLNDTHIFEFESDTGFS